MPGNVRARSVQTSWMLQHHECFAAMCPIGVQNARFPASFLGLFSGQLSSCQQQPGHRICGPRRGRSFGTAKFSFLGSCFWLQVFGHLSGCFVFPPRRPVFVPFWWSGFRPARRSQKTDPGTVSRARAFLSGREPLCCQGHRCCKAGGVPMSIEPRGQVTELVSHSAKSNAGAKGSLSMSLGKEAFIFTDRHTTIPGIHARAACLLEAQQHVN